MRPTAEIGPVQILREGVGRRGTRRIEAVTAGEAYAYLRGRSAEADQLRGEVEKLRKELKKRPAAAAGGAAAGAANGIDEVVARLLAGATTAGGVTVVAADLGEMEGDGVLELSDRIKSKGAPAAVALAAAFEGRVTIVVNLDASLPARGVNAGEIVKIAAPIVGGGGGGRPTMDRKNAYFRELIDAITPADLLPGIGDLLADLRARGVRTAIASMSHNVYDVVRHLGIEDKVDAIVDPATLVKGKPDPEIFLAAAEQLGVRFEDCLGIEDARAGIQAIKAARMVAVGVGADLPGCDWLVSDTRPLTYEALAALFPGTAASSPAASAGADEAVFRAGSAQPPAIAGSSRTVSRRLERRRELLEVPDVGLVHEHVHEPVDAARVVEQARAEVRVRGDQRAERLADGRALDLDQLLAAGRRPEHGRDADLAHADSQSSNAREARRDDRRQPRPARFGGPRLDPEPDRVGRLEPVAGQERDHLVAVADHAPPARGLRRRDRHAAGGLGVDALERRGPPDRVRRLDVGDRLDRPRGRPRQLHRVAPVGGVADRQRAHDRVGRPDRLDVQAAGGERRGDRRTAGGLTADEPDRLGRDPAELDQLLERPREPGDHRARRDRGHHDVGQPPTEVLGDLVAERLAALGVERAEVDVDRAPTAARPRPRGTGG